MTEETSKAETPSERAGGFRSQPLWLKALLVLSVAALAAGIVRCSFEATAPRERTEAACGD